MPPTHSPDAPPLIRLEGVRKTFRLPNGEAFDAVRPLTLQIHEGDVFGLVGKSGAGKSTLLRLVNLLERPDAGRVLVAGRDLTQLSRGELRAARQQIGMIFQQFNLIQNATVFDNVAFPLRIHAGHPRAEIDARVRECLALVGLAEKTDSYPAQLSGGQKQRVAIARALAPRPRVLLCDEPTSALDSETTRALLQTLREINQKIGVTIVIVTHELPVVEMLCRQVAILEKGQLVEQFAVDGQAGERSTVLGREIDALVRRRAREAAPRPPGQSARAVPQGWRMPENIAAILPELWLATGQTFLMLAIGLSAAILVGGPLGIVLFLLGPGQSLENRPLFLALNWFVNTVRSFPFIILLVALVPFTRVIAGTSIGPLAAAVPLSFAAIPYFARLVDQCLREVPRGVIEAAHAMGASELQIVLRVLLVEARSGLVLALTVLAVSFLSYSAVAGVVGGGGIGDLAIRYGYYRFQTDVMVLTVALLVVLVQILQFAGNGIAGRLDKR